MQAFFFWDLFRPKEKLVTELVSNLIVVSAFA